MIEYLGTLWFTGGDGHKRQYHLWGVVDDEGEVCAIHYGISESLQMASGEIARTDCDTPLRKHAFELAVDRYNAGRIDDSEEDVILIDEDDDFGEPTCH